MELNDNDNDSTASVSNPTASNAPNTATSPAPGPAVSQLPNAPIATQQTAALPSPAPSGPAQQKTVSNPSSSSAPTQQPDLSQQEKYPHASRVHDIAEILAGGPRVQTTVNPDGSRTVQRIPLTNKQVGLAIALEAISGSMAGLAGGKGRGPGAAGMAGFNMGRQQVQQRMDADRQQADEQSKALASKAQIVHNNLQMRQLAVSLGDHDYTENEKRVDQFKPYFDALKAKGAILPGTELGLSEDELRAHLPNFDKNNAIPAGVEYIYDQNGNQVTDAQGVPRVQLKYAVFDPTAHIDTSPEMLARAKYWNSPGYTNSTGEIHNGLDNTAVRSGMLLQDQLTTAQLDVAQTELLNYAAANGAKNVNPNILRDAINKGQLSRNDILALEKVEGGAPVDQAIKALAKADPNAAGKVAALYNSIYPIQKFGEDREVRLAGEKAKAEAEGKLPSELKLKQAERDNKAAEEQPLIESAAKSLANGDFTSLKDIVSMRGDERLKVYTRAKQINPNFNTKDIDIKVKTQEAYTTGKQGDQIQSFGTFLQHAGDAAEASAAYRRTGSPLLNKPLNWLAKNAENDQTYQSFITALQPVRDEYMTFLQNNHALHESDKKAADTIMSDNSTPAQIESALKMMGKTAFVRLGELNNRYHRVFGADYPDLLSDDAKGAANLLGLSNEAAKYQTGGRVTGSASGSIPGRAGAPTPPTGATMKVRGSDNKLHWSDGQRDLGVVQ